MGTITINGQGASAPTQSVMDTQINAQDRALSRMAEALASLEARLLPVLGQLEGAPPLNEKAAELSVPLAEILRCHTERIANSTQRVDTLLGQLGI